MSYTQRSAIDAASQGKRWPTTTAVNATSVHAASALAARRGTHFAFNDPVAARIADAWCASLLGETGPRPQLTEFDKALAAPLERGFARWARRAGVNDDDLLSLAYQAVRSMVIEGEAFLHLTDLDGRLRLTLLDSNQVNRSLTRELASGGRIVQGVEFDAAGIIAAYHVLPEPPASPFPQNLTAQRIDAADILHVFRPLTAGQVRGLTWLTPVMTVLAEIGSIRDAQLARARVSALFAGFVRDPDGGAAGLDANDGAFLEGGLEPGVLKILRPGQDITFSAPAQTGDIPDFLKSQLHAVAAGVGLTYAQLTGDLSDANYSSTRAGALEHRRLAGALQRQTIGPRFYAPIWRRWALLQALRGEMDAETFDADPDALLDADWLWPGWAQVDPLKEAQADIAAVTAGLKSRREVIAARGRDPDAVLDEITQDRAAAQPTPPPPTPTEDVDNDDD
ncbi:MAG: phage portal protein [Maricaulaceae bacterium]